MVEDKAIEHLNATRLDALEEKALAQLDRTAGNGYVRLHKLEFSALVSAVRGLHRVRQLLESQIQSRHDYGPASPGEQEAGWQQYCKRSGWDPSSHPAAKNAYVEGFCDGDSFSEGDEGRATLRQEIERLQERNGIVEERENLLVGIGAEARRQVERLTQQLAEMQSTFDLRWEADRRATKLWQAEKPERELTWPDHVDLCVWLEAKVEAQAAELDYWRDAVVMAHSDDAALWCPFCDVVRTSTLHPMTHENDCLWVKAKDALSSRTPEEDKEKL